MRGFDISHGGGGGGGYKLRIAFIFFPDRYITGRAYEWVRGLGGWLRYILFTRLLILFFFRLTIHARTQKSLFFNTCNQKLLRQSHK